VVPNSALAEEMGVSPGSVSEMLGKLATLKLIVHDPYRGARLTAAGLKVAVEMIRHHRLIETYLVQALGYGWDEVHEEADRLEHSISELLEERMWQALGRPAFDPHGDPIPAPDGTLVEHPTLPLQSAPAGSEVVISRISDLLIYLIPHYAHEGKSYLTISFGCTGGHHRSVLIADAITRNLAGAGYNVKVSHRDQRR